MLTWLKSLIQGSGQGHTKSSTNTTGKVQHEEEYRGYWLSIAPKAQGGQYRIAATIYKLDNPERVHQLIRADLLPSLDLATQQTLAKARQAVDQLGESMFR